MCGSAGRYDLCPRGSQSGRHRWQPPSGRCVCASGFEEQSFLPKGEPVLTNHREQDTGAHPPGSACLLVPSTGRLSRGGDILLLQASPRHGIRLIFILKRKTLTFEFPVLLADVFITLTGTFMPLKQQQQQTVLKEIEGREGKRAHRFCPFESLWTLLKAINYQMIRETRGSPSPRPCSLLSSFRLETIPRLPHPQGGSVSLSTLLRPQGHEKRERCHRVVGLCNAVSEVSFPPTCPVPLAAEAANGAPAATTCGAFPPGGSGPGVGRHSQAPSRRRAFLEPSC